jgi:hypothetical protein
MIEEIKETIRVKAIFADGHLRPEAFVWRRRAYSVRQIHGAYDNRLGRAKQLHYSVGCGGDDVYEIALDTDLMEWRLDRIHTPG